MSGRPKRKTTREPGGARQTKLTKFFGNSSTVKSAPRGKDSQCVPEQVSGSRCQETTDEIVVIRDESGDEQGGASHPAGTCVVSNAPPEGQEVAQEAFWRCGNDGMNPPKVAHVATEQIQACSEPSVPNTLQRVSSAPTPNSDGTVPCDTKLVIDSDSRPRQRGLAEASYGHGECQGEGSDHDTGVENLLTSGIAVLADTCSFNPSLFPMPPLIPFKIQTHFLKLT